MNILIHELDIFQTATVDTIIVLKNIIKSAKQQHCKCSNFIAVYN